MSYNPQKIPLSLPSPASENLRRLADLFPSIIKDGEVDFTALKEELGIFEETGKEQYELTWAGKQQAKRIAAEPVVGRTLKYIPEESNNADTTENLYIEGDNLEVLKLLQNGYMGKIKMIYIDPPYNTGTDRVYRDNFAVSARESDQAEGRIGDDGERLAVNPKTSARYHANWLSMMYPRLRLAKNLLSDDGVIFISIDDNEAGNLREICDEIFGGKNFIATLIWDKNHSAQAGIYKVYHEYVLVFSKNISHVSPPRSLNHDIFDAGAMKKESGRHSLQPFIFPKGTRIEASEGTEFKGTWGDTEKVILNKGKMVVENGVLKEDVELIAAYTQVDQMRQYFYGDRESLVDSKGQKIVEFYLNSSGKVHVLKERSVESCPTILKFGTQGQSSTDLANLYGTTESPFSSPKPVDMISDFISRFTSNGDIILDFFSGSATTGASLFMSNADQNIHRKFILVQYPENLDESIKHATKDDVNTLKTAISYLDSIGKPHLITEIGKKRLCLSGVNIQTKNPEISIDLGFKVFRTADTNIRWIAAETGQTTLEDVLLGSGKDLRDFMPGTKDLDVVYEILLRQYDIPLTANIEQRSEIGPRTYSIADTIIVCLEETITEDIISKLAAAEPVPHKIILRDSAFADDISLKENAMMRLDALMQKHSTGGRLPYTVEFL